MACLREAAVDGVIDVAELRREGTPSGVRSSRAGVTQTERPVMAA